MTVLILITDSRKLCLSVCVLSVCWCFRETVAQMIQTGHRVIDNPIYLSDLGTTLLFSLSPSVGLCLSAWEREFPSKNMVLVL